MSEDFLEENLVRLGNVGGAGFDSFSVRCPECGETICQLSAPEITGFEAVCPGCGTALFLDDAVAMPDYYEEWCRDGESLEKGKERYESVDADDLKRVFS